MASLTSRIPTELHSVDICAFVQYKIQKKSLFKYYTSMYNILTSSKSRQISGWICDAAQDKENDEEGKDVG